MEVKDNPKMADLVFAGDDGVAIVPMEQLEDLITSKVITNIFRRLWFNTTRDGDEIEEIFELVFGDRYGEDEDDAE